MRCCWNNSETWGGEEHASKGNIQTVNSIIYVSFNNLELWVGTFIITSDG